MSAIQNGKRTMAIAAPTKSATVIVRIEKAEIERRRRPRDPKELGQALVCKQERAKHQSCVVSGGSGNA